MTKPIRKGQKIANTAKLISRGQRAFEKAKFELFGREYGQLATLINEQQNQLNEETLSGRRHKLGQSLMTTTNILVINFVAFIFQISEHISIYFFKTIVIQLHHQRNYSQCVNF